MYKGYQEEMFQNPWGVNVGFKHLSDKLNELLPFEGRCEFPNSKNKNLEKFRKLSLSNFDKKIFINNLNKIGYNCDKGYSNDVKERLLTVAFQRRFRQELVDGKIDKECLLISKNLI